MYIKYTTLFFFQNNVPYITNKNKYKFYTKKSFLFIIYYYFSYNVFINLI